jgi:hypothetical protein
MPITTLHEEIAIDDLVGTIFNRLDAAARKKVVAAVIKANPQVEGLDRLAAGTVLTIPTVSGVTLDPAAGPWGFEDPATEGRDWVTRAVRDYGEHLAQRHELLQAQLKEQLELLDDQSLKEALRDRPDAAQLVPEIETAIKARAEEAASLQREVEAAVNKLTENLENL